MKHEVSGRAPRRSGGGGKRVGGSGNRRLPVLTPGTKFPLHDSFASTTWVFPPLVYFKPCWLILPCLHDLDCRRGGGSTQQLTPAGMLKVVTAPKRPKTTQNPPSWVAKEKESLAQPVPRSGTNHSSRPLGAIEGKAPRATKVENTGTARTAGSTRNLAHAFFPRQRGHPTRNGRDLSFRIRWELEEQEIAFVSSLVLLPGLPEISTGSTLLSFGFESEHRGYYFLLFRRSSATTSQTVPRMGLT